MKARVVIYNFNGEEFIWWTYLKLLTKVTEKKISWKWFKKSFKQKYLSERHYDGKNKEYHGLKVGQMTMDECYNKFLELLSYPPYIKDEKVKINHFLRGLPQCYKDRIEFNEPKILHETINKKIPL